MNPFTLLIHYGLPFLCVLTILVFIHELGHYLVARWNRVRVEVFSIGFGPEIFGWTDRAGTRWKVSLLPFGGYVRMFGEVASEEAEGAEQKPLTEADRAVSFSHKRLGQRASNRRYAFCFRRRNSCSRFRLWEARPPMCLTRKCRVAHRATATVTFRPAEWAWD